MKNKTNRTSNISLARCLFIDNLIDQALRASGELRTAEEMRSDEEARAEHEAELAAEAAYGAWIERRAEMDMERLAMDYGYEF